MPRQLLVEAIRVDGDTQSRERINEETVGEYAEAMKSAAKAPWPALLVFFDGTEYWLADGFHRLLAARRIGKKNIMAEVKDGSREDAAWASCAANQTHGLRRTNADKRKAVAIALKLQPKMSDRAIAGHCGLSDPFVGQVRRQVLTVSTSTPRTGTDGKQYPVPPARAKDKPAQGLGPPPRPEDRPVSAAATVPKRAGAPADASLGSVLQEDAPAGTAGKAEPCESPSPAAAAAGVGRKPDVPIDDVGRRIPDHLMELWGRRQEVQDMLTAVSRVRVALQKAQDTRDPLFSEVPYSAALAHLDQAYDAVQVAKPYAVCAVCQGHGCKTCLQRGLLGKFRWDNTVPVEHKEAVARLIENQRSREVTAGKGGGA